MLDRIKATHSEERASTSELSTDIQASRAARERWDRLGLPESRAQLFDPRAEHEAALYTRNVESYVGTARLPLGIVGPLRVNGHRRSTDYLVPLATTEAALVASYNRGSRLLTAVGGCTARVLRESLGRTPMFAFQGLEEAIRFADFVESRIEEMRQTVSTTTRYGRLVTAHTVTEGNHVYVELCFSTGDAAGQNMVTFAAEAICTELLRTSPVPPRHWFLEANLSGDKKASAKSLADVRGRRVSAEAVIPAGIIRDQLHTTARRMVEYWYAGAIGGVMSGTIGVQGHFANGLAALYIACGQDVACVAESATGVTRLELTDFGDLYASVTLPNIVVGTVGGGTTLPSAAACLDILGLRSGGSNELAEVCSALVLAGELSIIGALCSGDFALAHRALSRGEVLARETRQ